DGELVQSQITDANGFYLFTGLCAGDYEVLVDETTLPMGFVASPCEQGMDPALDSNCQPALVTLPTNSSQDLTIDFGYYLVAPAIDIEKYTNGEDADDPSGPIVAVGSPVEWTYVVTNIGNVELINVMVSDDQGVMVTCPETSLMPGESMTCTGQGIAMEGQYANLGTATGEYNGITVEDTDPSHYFGAAAAIDIEKYTNGEDADDPTGPIVSVGSPIEWTYVVTNIGNVALMNVTVTDDQGVVVTCEQDTLAVGEFMICTAQGTAIEGQYANLGTATGDYNGMTVQDSDPSHYYGVAPSIDFEKYVSMDGMTWFDADEAPGLYVPVCPNGNGYNDGKDCYERDHYWSKYESSKSEYEKKKSEYEKSKDERDRAKSDYEKSKKVKDESKAKCDSRKSNYDSAKSRYEKYSTRYNKSKMDEAKGDYDKEKHYYENAKSHYESKKSDYEKKKSDCDRKKSVRDKAKSDYEKAKSDWEKYGDKDCRDGKIDSKCGDFECDSFVYFRFLITNDGPVMLTDITLEDTVFDTSSCELPPTLAPGQSYECVIGPFDAVAGQHKNTGTAIGTYAGIEVMDSDDAHYYGKVGKGTGTPGYWKNHPEAWPVDKITIGGVHYDKTKAIEWMNKSVRRDKTLTLFPALVAAKLNVLSGNVSYCIDEVIALADQWMQTSPAGSGVEASSSAWAMAEPWYMLLDDYNNGLLCAPSRDCLEKDESNKGKGTKSTSYWKGKDKSWPSSSVRAGGKTYYRSEATKHMKSPSNKDVTYTLFRALVTAKLNVAEGNSKSCIEDTIKSADSWLEKYGPVGRNLSSQSRAWREGEPLFQTLDDYNNGKLCAPFAKDEITSWLRRW
ncbi:DUF7507 domain-containing protein, partial [Geoalkalibacter halelectricus]|uniref:DUF7507 domain-containing protein n=1 Tax=Geoalkalibacter halelectricus TaxID=2847045 RepID=UPI003D1990C7